MACAGIVVSACVVGCLNVDREEVTRLPSADDSNTLWAERARRLFADVASCCAVDLSMQSSANRPILIPPDSKIAVVSPGEYRVVGGYLALSDRTTDVKAALPVSDIIGFIEAYDKKTEPPLCDCPSMAYRSILMQRADGRVVGVLSFDNHDYMSIQAVGAGWHWSWFGGPASLSKLGRR
jgi:hypothetical protein